MAPRHGGADLVSFALGWLPEENKVVFRFQKVPASKQTDLMLFNNSQETLQIVCCSGCKMHMQFCIFMAVFLEYPGVSCSMD